MRCRAEPADNPVPVPLSDPAWNRLQSLVNGRAIVVNDPVHCFFAGVTEASLFCNPPRVSLPAWASVSITPTCLAWIWTCLARQRSSRAAPRRNYIRLDFHVIVGSSLGS